MAEIIEEENVDSLLGTSLVAFQTTDLKALAAKILHRANEVAQQKIAAAAQTAAAQEKKAYDAGLAKGLAEGEKKGEAAGRAAGEKAARDEFGKTVSGVATALKAALAELNKCKMQLQADAEADLLHLALAVAKRIVRRELVITENAVLPIVREAISLCNNRSDLTLHLNPADVAAVEQEIPILQGVFTDLGRVDLRADDNVERGGALLQNRASTVDLRLAQQFAALDRALAGSDNDPFDHLPPVPDDELTAEEAAIAAPNSNVPAAAAENPSATAPLPAETPAVPSAAPIASETAAAPETITAAETSADNSIPDTAPAPAAAPPPPASCGLGALRSLHNFTADAATEAAIAAALSSR